MCGISGMNWKNPNLTHQQGHVKMIGLQRNIYFQKHIASSSRLHNQYYTGNIGNKLNKKCCN